MKKVLISVAVLLFFLLGILEVIQLHVLHNSREVSERPWNHEPRRMERIPHLNEPDTLRLRLHVDDLNFHSSFKTEVEAKKTQKNFAEAFHPVIMTIRPFGVAIIRFDPKTRVVTEWEKSPGFSLWVQ